MRVLVLNGPNLGRLGSREPDVYGDQDLSALRVMLTEAAAEGDEIDLRQTDDEAELIGWLHEAVDRHRRILDLLSLPTTYPAGRWPTLLATMKRDKKARGDLLRFIVLDDIGRPTTLTGPEEQLLFAAYQEISA